MQQYLFDVETNGYLHQATRMWILRVYDYTTKTQTRFLEGDLGWVELFDKADVVIGHNILGFDLPLLLKLFKYKLPKRVKTRDTLILSQVLDYKRFGERGHSLEVWGEGLGLHKIHFDRFDEYSEEMDIYCERDVDLNVIVDHTLMGELVEIAQKNPQIYTYLKAEHAASRWCASANLEGWPFDVVAATALHEDLQLVLDKTHEALSTKLGYKAVATDKEKGIVEEKVPKWTKQGCYAAHTASWFGVDPWSGYEGEERMIIGPYTRCEIVPLSLDSVADVKIFLYRNGWVPTQWNYKRDPDTNEMKRTSPKVTEDSLEFLGGDGKLYADFLTAKARFGILDTWLKVVDSDGNLHGDCMVVGTPSMRARHSIIVNVPSADSAYGPEMRKLFGSRPGWTLIGCDSAGNQARGLAHYLGDDGFIDTLLNGDIHQFNADILTGIVQRDLGRIGPFVTAEEAAFFKTFVVKRSQAKRILYAFLFGASGSKLYSYIFDTVHAERGNIVKNGFIKAVPGFKNLVDKLNKMYTATCKYGEGYIYSIAGNKVYVDSRHKLLVYLLQSAEKITCSVALMWAMEKFEAEGIPYKPCIFYHDEIDFMVPDEYKERAAEIGKLAFKEAPKLFGITIMDGEAKLGQNWYEVH